MATIQHLRSSEPGSNRVTTLELFFDLVFVFAITQLSHFLIDHLTFKGTLQATFLLLVVWWAWTYTTWMTNWFDPHQSKQVRVMLLVVMGFGLLMSVALPGAFDKHSLLFAASYVAVQVIRNAFNVWALRGGRGEEAWHSSMLRLFWWSIAAGTLWIGGALIGGEYLVPIWLAALAVDYLGPYAGYWTPGLGSSTTTDWTIDAHHFSERFQLLIIVALGESIVVTGATAYKSDLGPDVILALATAFAITGAMWWLYFNFIAERATERLAAAEDPGRLARDGYTYLHLPIIMGIIVAAVADELLIAHPNESFYPPIIAVAGPVLYLLGHNCFRLVMARSISMNRLIATFALLAIIPLAEHVSALTFSLCVFGILLALIVREHFLSPPPLTIEA